MGNRSPFREDLAMDDELNIPVVTMLKLLWNSGYAIVIVSGRDFGRGDTVLRLWLEKHDIHYDELFLRAAGDCRKDSIVKKEIYENNIKNKYDIMGIYDDRPQVIRMWRNELNLFVFDVGKGIEF